MFSREKEYKQLDLNKRAESNKNRERLYNKFYLGEIIEKESPEFGSNNLIMAPVGSGKSHLIENRLIPEGFSGNIVYLTSNTALKDSICPNNNQIREKLAKEGKSVKFFTTQNKKRYGDKKYNVHVMTYHEFGKRIFPPTEKLTSDVDLIFCDEIHSLPIYMDYGNNGELFVALRWLFGKHSDKKIFYFTATRESLKELERKMPGYMDNIKEFDYLNHPEIRRYEVKSVYYISHLAQLRMHLSAKIAYVKRSGVKGLAFTRKITEQERIATIAKQEGYTPITIWSVNNDDKEMSEEQIRVRDYLLETGNIPEPYNLLIINNAMQEGWNLFDNKVDFAILNTVDKTERVQALGRIRKDVDFIIIKTNETNELAQSVVVDKRYLNKPLTTIDKRDLSDTLNVIGEDGKRVKWTTIRKILEEKGYIITDSSPTIDGKRTRVSTITESV